MWSPGGQGSASWIPWRGLARGVTRSGTMTSLSDPAGEDVTLEREE